MLFSAAFALSLLPLGWASPLEVRSAQTIVTGVAKVSSDLAALNKTLNGFKPNDVLSTFTALTIQQQSTTIQNDLNSVISTTQSTGNLNQTDSNTVAVAVVNLEPAISSTLNNIVVHKPAFATAFLLVGDLSKTVLQTLQNLKNASDTFGSVLIPKLSEPYRDVAPIVVSQIDGYFTKAIAAYQNCTGLVCLPPI